MSQAAYAWTLLILTLPVQLWSGFVLSVLWGWFVVPLGVPPIGVLQATGLTLTVDLVKLVIAPPREGTPQDYLQRWLITYLAGPLMVLTVATIVFLLWSPR